ncbi:MAG: sensor histidine kinase [Croceibacterium sp.]
MVALYVAANSYAGLAADRSYDRLLAGSALSIAETLSVANNRVTVDIPYAALDMLSAAPSDRVFYRVSSSGGVTVTGYPDLPAAPRASRRPVNQAGALPDFFDARYRGEEVRFVILQRELAPTGTANSIQVQVGQTRQARDGMARDLLFGALAPIVLMTLLALAVVWFGIKVALRPLSRISLELLQREPNSLGELQTPVPADLAPMVDALNQFMRRLAANIDTLTNFIADAAHQIRTPLAAISAQAQLAELEDPQELKTSVASIRRHASRLTRLVNQLLSDATTTHRSDVRLFANCDLLRIVQTAVRESVPLSEDSDVRLTCTLSEAPFWGDAVMLGEAVKNLVHNALVHGRGDEGEVLLTLEQHGTGYRLLICDRGPGVPTEKRNQIFMRHVRGTTSGSGAGLGMAIVGRVVEAHGGTIHLSDRAGGGLCVATHLPGRGL